MKWVSLKEKEPEYGQKVFVSDGKHGGVAVFIAGIWFDAPEPLWGKITHWAPIPTGRLLQPSEVTGDPLMDLASRWPQWEGV